MRRATPRRSILGRSAAGRACATVASAALVCLASCASSASEVASTQEALCADGATIEFVDVSQHQGTIDCEGPPAEMFAQPPTERFEKFIARAQRA